MDRKWSIDCNVCAGHIHIPSEPKLIVESAAGLDDDNQAIVVTLTSADTLEQSCIDVFGRPDNEFPTFSFMPLVRCLLTKHDDDIVRQCANACSVWTRILVFDHLKQNQKRFIFIGRQSLETVIGLTAANSMNDFDMRSSKQYGKVLLLPELPWTSEVRQKVEINVETFIRKTANAKE